MSGQREGRTTEVASQHEIENEEAVFVVLKSISQIDDKRMVDLEWRDLALRGKCSIESCGPAPHLLKQPPLLNNVRNGFHTDTFCFVDVFEGIELARLFVLDDSNLYMMQGRAEEKNCGCQRL